MTAQEPKRYEDGSRFKPASHPTAVNGQCPECYSAGYEAADHEARAQVEALREALRELQEFHNPQDDYPSEGAVYLADGLHEGVMVYRDRSPNLYAALAATTQTEAK